MAAKPILGYWDTRALCESIRLLLAHAGVEYDDVRYEVGPPPAYDKSSWDTQKFQLGLAAPNLPYWIEPGSGVELTQSHAILFHIADAHGLSGGTAVQRARVRMVVEVVKDWLETFFSVTYCNAPGFEQTEPEPGVHVLGEPQALSTSPKFELRRSTYLREALPVHLAHLLRLLQSSTTAWVGGTEEATCADLCVAEVLDQHLMFDPNCLDHPEHEPLRSLLQRVLALPRIQAYRSSGGFRAEPVHNRYSHFHRGWAARDPWAREAMKRSATNAHLAVDMLRGVSGGGAERFSDTEQRPTKQRRCWRDTAVFVCLSLLVILLIHGASSAIAFNAEQEEETNFALPETITPPACINEPSLAPCASCCCGAH
jgi:glutathione S-transferase